MQRRTPAFILSASTEHADDPGRTGKDFLSRRILCRCYESSFEGGGFKFCPHADCRDGKLNIIVVSGLSKLKVLLLLPTAFFGLHTRFHGVHTYTCHSAEFLSAAELPVHTDGEPVLRQQRMMVRLENEKLLMKIINK